MNENIDKFIKEFEASLAANSFVKLTLGNYRGSSAELQKILVRPIETQAGVKLSFVFRYITRDVTKTVAVTDAGAEIAKLLSSGFRAGQLMTLSEDIRLTVGKRNSRIFKDAAVHSVPSLSHNRSKSGFINENAPYLRPLGITSGEGRVYARQQDKWRQINKFVEILDGLWKRSPILDKKTVSIVDMGSGKGYLTFAAYDHFANNLGMEVKMLGIDSRRDMVELCDTTARSIGYSGLNFIRGEIADVEIGPVDILIALNAAPPSAFLNHSSLSAVLCRDRVYRPPRPRDRQDIRGRPRLRRRSTENLRSSPVFQSQDRCR